MHFTVQRDDLHATLSAVARATATRVIQPILSNVLLESLSPEQLRLTATDLDFTIQATLPGMVLTPGRTTIAAKKLLEIVSKLPSGAPITLEADPQVATARIACGPARFDIRTMPADEYPLIPALDQDQYLEVSLKALLNAIAHTAYAAASFETNSVLGGVFFSLSQTQIEMAATDGSRLARAVEGIASPGLPEEPISAIIPAKALQELVRLVGQPDQADARVRLVIRDGQMAFRTERAYVVSRLLDGQYPRYQQLIPEGNPMVATANRQALIASLERTAVMASDRTNLVKMTFDNGTVSLAANTPDLGDSKDEVAVQFNGGEPLGIAFNYRYVLDALRVIDGDDVRMEMNGPLGPTLFRAGDDSRYLALVMPVQVK